MKENAADLLSTQGLAVSMRDGKELIPVVHPCDISVKRGGCTGIIGESGCGKSMICRALLGLHAPEQWQIGGQVYLDGEQVPIESDDAMDGFRGRRMTMILQEPLSAFDSRMTIGAHFLEGCRRKQKALRRQGAEEWLKRMDLQDPGGLMKRYPFELSGGMLQRVMIALSLMTEPELLIADEPTTALDSTVQREILLLLAELKKERNLSLLLVSHDLRVISRMADRIYVMYAGQIVEWGAMEELMENPLHPYTKGLIRSRPSYSKERLTAMTGRPPRVGEWMGAGCPFAPRCPEAAGECSGELPELKQTKGEHFVRCCRQWDRG
ncbi:MAG: ABC transporter ATP-binding protein [Lachnospiraceae bacterium]|nr:ABC transporter ATP-binding protein [Lachnospiraceae bacterium]